MSSPSTTNFNRRGGGRESTNRKTAGIWSSKYNFLIKLSRWLVFFLGLSYGNDICVAEGLFLRITHKLWITHLLWAITNSSYL